MSQYSKTKYWALDEIKNLQEVVRYEKSLREKDSDSETDEEFKDFPENKVDEEKSETSEPDSNVSPNRDSLKKQRSAKVNPALVNYDGDEEEACEEELAEQPAEPEWEVERIIDKRREGRGFQYKVIWKYWPRKSATWEPSSNLTNCDEKIEEFEKKLAELV
jgi:hypothetical protein